MLCNVFVKKRNRVEACCYIAVTPGILLRMQLKLHEFLLLKNEGIIIYDSLKSPTVFHVEKHGIIWKKILTQKLTRF